MALTSSTLDSVDVLLAGATEWVETFGEALEGRTDASVRIVPAADSTLEVFREQSVDCVLTEYKLDGSTGLELLHAIREGTATLPVLMCTASGSEAVASDAIAAGVTDYVALNGPVDARIDELLALDVDVLVPAALGNVLTERNANDVAADLVEGANGPTTSRADAILAERDVAVIPDILANAGGVTVSYFEWLQDINRRSWSLERVNDELDAEMRAAWRAVRSEFERRDVTWRDAAYIVALARIAKAHEARGLWP